MGLVGLTYFNEDKETEGIIADIIKDSNKKLKWKYEYDHSETSEEYLQRLEWYSNENPEPIVPIRVKVLRIILASTFLLPIWLFMFAGLLMFPCSIILPFAIIATVPMLFVKKWREEDLPDMWTAAMFMVIVPYQSLTNYIQTGEIKF